MNKNNFRCSDSSLWMPGLWSQNKIIFGLLYLFRCSTKNTIEIPKCLFSCRFRKMNGPSRLHAELFAVNHNFVDNVFWMEKSTEIKLVWLDRTIQNIHIQNLILIHYYDRIQILLLRIPAATTSPFNTSFRLIIFVMAQIFFTNFPLTQQGQ